MELSKQERLETLMMNNPKLYFEDACKLLGYDPRDPQLHDPRSPLGIFQDIFGKETK